MFSNKTKNSVREAKLNHACKYVKKRQKSLTHPWFFFIILREMLFTYYKMHHSADYRLWNLKLSTQKIQDSSYASVAVFKDLRFVD